jgi:hypothetical protein
MRAIRIAEDTRLSRDELLACFAQALGAEMPEVTPEVVDKVFVTVTRTNLDGRMSVRDLRQWYISFGKRALREGIPFEADGAGIVSPMLVARHGFAHARNGSGQVRSAASERLLPGSGAAAAPGPLYPWEQDAPVGGPEEGGAAGAPVSLPHGMLEFQIRLTPEQWAQVQLRRRQLDAEARYTARLTQAKERERDRDASGRMGPPRTAQQAASVASGADGNSVLYGDQSFGEY